MKTIDSFIQEKLYIGHGYESNNISKIISLVNSLGDDSLSAEFHDWVDVFVKHYGYNMRIYTDFKMSHKDNPIPKEYFKYIKEDTPDFCDKFETNLNLTKPKKFKFAKGEVWYNENLFNINYYCDPTDINIYILVESEEAADIYEKLYIGKGYKAGKFKIGADVRWGSGDPEYKLIDYISTSKDEEDIVKFITTNATNIDAWGKDIKNETELTRFAKQKLKEYDYIIAIQRKNSKDDSILVFWYTEVFKIYEKLYIGKDYKNPYDMTKYILNLFGDQADLQGHYDDLIKDWVEHNNITSPEDLMLISSKKPKDAAGVVGRILKEESVKLVKVVNNELVSTLYWKILKNGGKTESRRGARGVKVIHNDDYLYIKFIYNFFNIILVKTGSVDEKLYISKGYNPYEAGFIKKICDTITSYLYDEYKISPSSYTITCRNADGNIIDSPTEDEKDVKSIAVYLGKGLTEDQRSTIVNDLSKEFEDIVKIGKLGWFGNTLFLVIK